MPSLRRVEEVIRVQDVNWPGRDAFRDRRGKSRFPACADPIDGDQIAATRFEPLDPTDDLIEIAAHLSTLISLRTRAPG